MFPQKMWPSGRELVAILAGLMLAGALIGAGLASLLWWLL